MRPLVQAALQQGQAVGQDKARMWWDIREKEMVLRRWEARCDRRAAIRAQEEVSLATFSRLLGNWPGASQWQALT